MGDKFFHIYYIRFVLASYVGFLKKERRFYEENEGKARSLALIRTVP